MDLTMQIIVGVLAVPLAGLQSAHPGHVQIQQDEMRSWCRNISKAPFLLQVVEQFNTITHRTKVVAQSRLLQRLTSEHHIVDVVISHNDDNRKCPVVQLLLLR